LGVLVDGEPKQLRAVKAEAHAVGIRVNILVDFVRVLKYIWNAAPDLFGETNAKAETIRWWAACRKLDD
jgi:hypothetical protein